MKYTLIIGLSLLISCSKNASDDPAKLTALTTGSWKLFSYTTDYQKDGFYEENSYALMGECNQDNFYTFQSDGNVIEDQGAIKCSGSDPQTRTLQWSFKEHQTQLLLGGTTYQIEDLSSTMLKLMATVPYNVIYTINEKLVYIKQ